jgi:hypothetical protein
MWNFIIYTDQIKKVGQAVILYTSVIRPTF